MTKQHGCKEITKLLKDLEKKGFTVSAKSKKGSVKITPPISIGGSVYHTHATQSSLHQIRRDFARMYDVII
jgi:hypothetical protein